MADELKKRLSFEELEVTAEFRQLTQKQKLFVKTYVSGGMLDGKYDSINATRTAYVCRTPEIARVMSYAMMTNIRIVAVLNRHFNAEPLEEFLRILDRAIVNKKLTPTQFQVLKLKGDILGFTTKLPGLKHPPELEVAPSADLIEPPAKQKRKSPTPPKPAGKSEYEKIADQF